MAATAAYWGTLVLRMADSKVLPLNHTDQAVALQTYVEDLEELLENKNASHKLDVSLLKAAVQLYQEAAESVQGLP